MYPNPVQDTLDVTSPVTVLWDYVGFEFLNAYLNHLEIISCLILDNTDPEAEYDPEYMTVEEVIEEQSTEFHKNYGTLCCNKWVLAKSDTHFWFFYYDADVSDCALMIVSFSRITEEDFVNLMKEEAEKEDDVFNVIEVDLKENQGWIEF